MKQILWMHLNSVNLVDQTQKGMKLLKLLKMNMYPQTKHKINSPLEPQPIPSKDCRIKVRIKPKINLKALLQVKIH